MAEELASILKTFDEVFVYRIGKRGTRGHVAKDWGLETPLLTAVMTVSRSGLLRDDATAALPCLTDAALLPRSRGADDDR